VSDNDWHTTLPGKVGVVRKIKRLLTAQVISVVVLVHIFCIIAPFCYNWLVVSAFCHGGFVFVAVCMSTRFHKKLLTDVKVNVAVLQRLL